MNCPYCDTTVSDAALVCAACQRDLSFFKPIFQEVLQTQKNLSLLQEKVVELRQNPNDALGLLEIAPIVFVLLSAILATACTWVDWQPWVGSNKITDTLIEALSVMAPFVAGFGLGVFRRLRPSAYLALGWIAGLIGFAQMVVLFSIGRMDQALVASGEVCKPKCAGSFTMATPKHWIWSFFAYQVAGACLFFSGGRLSEWRRGAANVREPVHSESIEKWIKLLTPVLGSIVAILQVIFHK